MADKEENLLELLELYMDFVEKQDEIIWRLSDIMKRQATEIKHMKNLEEYADFENGMVIAEEVIEKYNEMKGEP